MSENSSERERIKRAWQQLESGDIENLNVDDLMSNHSREEFNSYIKDWMVDRTSIAIHVTSTMYTFHNQFMTETYNTGRDEHFNKLDEFVRGHLNDMIDVIKPYCKKGIPFLESRVQTEVNMNSYMVIVRYKVAINKHDLNYLKIKIPNVYHKITGYTIDKPMRIE